MARVDEQKNIGRMIDSDGLRQTKYQVLESSTIPEFSRILVNLFYAKETSVKT